MARGWKDALLRTEKGALLPVSANVETILRKDPFWRGVLAYDDFLGDVIAVKPPPWGDLRYESKPGPFTEADCERLNMWLQRQYRLTGAPTSLIAKAAVVAAQNTKRLHPVREYLSKLKWDKKKRLDDFLIRLAGVDDSKYTREVCSKWMISAVARAFEPGCQVDSVLVLEGGQGSGKTSALRILAIKPEWFLETSAEIGTKDSYQVLTGRWIVEFGELDSLGRAELSRVKQYITERYSTYRAAYAAKVASYPRGCVFAGSTNEDEYLKDNTGARRFWPIRIPKGRRIDLKRLEKERDQLWAEAVARYKAGEAWHITDTKVLDAAREIAEERRQGDPWETPVALYLNDRKHAAKLRITGVTTYDIAMHGLHLEPSRLTRGEEMRIGSILRVLNWGVKRRIREPSGLRIWRYYPENEAMKLGQVGPVRPVNPEKMALGPTSNLVQLDQKRSKKGC